MLTACATIQKVDKAYAEEIMSYRVENQKSKTIGDRAPLKEKDLSKLDYFQVNPEAKITAEFAQVMDSKPFEMSTYSGITKPFKLYGTAYFRYQGKDLKLNVYQNLQSMRMPQYRDLLFLPFKDLTNDEESYGGGRYIDLKTGDIKNGSLIIDFNKAYNPWCAYADGYNCPIPPRFNHLDVAIHAGEKNYKK